MPPGKGSFRFGQDLPHLIGSKGLVHDHEIGQRSMGMNVRVDLQPVDQPVFMPDEYGEGTGAFADAKAKRAFSTFGKALNVSRNLNLEALPAALHRLSFAASELRPQHGCEIPGMLNNLLEDGLLRVGRSFHVLSLRAALLKLHVQI